MDVMRQLPYVVRKEVIRCGDNPLGNRFGGLLILRRRWSLARGRQADLTDEMGADSSPSLAVRFLAILVGSFVQNRHLAAEGA